MKIRFNYLKIFSQDYPLGQMISLVMSLGEMVKLAIFKPSRDLWMFFGLVFKVKPGYSMLSTVRLLTLYQLVKDVQQQGLLGDIVECGVGNGGASAIMARSYLDAGGNHERSIWVFDSFEGLPPPSERDGQMVSQYYFKGFSKGNLDKVRFIFNKLSVPFDHVKVVTGWVEDTLPKNNLKQVALLHIDTNWYESVKAALDNIYDKVVVGGFIIVDDFLFFNGCRDAVLDFLKERGIEDKVRINKVDRSAVYFQKV